MTPIVCSACGSPRLIHDVKKGRGRPPVGYVKRPGDRRLISWAGIWDYYTCSKCGHEQKKLRR